MWLQTLTQNTGSYMTVGEREITRVRKERTKERKKETERRRVGRAAIDCYIPGISPYAETVGEPSGKKKKKITSL